MGAWDYTRVQHTLIAQVLAAIDGSLLVGHHCYFGGGTAIALLCGEYRLSNDIDFLVSDTHGYRELRRLVEKDGPRALFRPGHQVSLPEKLTSDEYGIRGYVSIKGVRIKLEIVAEGRIVLDEPPVRDQVEGVPCLSVSDLAAEKILANADRYMDSVTFNRDLIDLAFLNPNFRELSRAVIKAQGAYGAGAMRDLRRSASRFQDDASWAKRCLQALDVSEGRAGVVARVNRLLRRLELSEQRHQGSANQ